MPLPLPDKEKRVQDDLDFASNAISTQVRLISLGCLAVFWAILSGTEPVLLNSFSAYKWVLFLSAAFAVVTLLLDLAQYRAGYEASELAKERLKAQPEADAYDENWPAYQRRKRYFRWKLVTCYISAGLVLLAISFVLLGCTGAPPNIQTPEPSPAPTRTSLGASANSA